MNNIIKNEIEEKIIELEVSASYIPCYNILSDYGCDLSDLKFRLKFFKNENDTEVCHSYIGFSDYTKEYFLTRDSNIWGIENFESIMKYKSLESFYECEETQIKLLEDLQEADKILEIIEELINDGEWCW